MAVTQFETGKVYQFVGGSDYRHKFWNKSKHLWKDGRPRECISVDINGRASFQGIPEPTGKYAGKTGWNYGFCLDKFADVTPRDRPASSPSQSAPAITFPKRGSVTDFLASVIGQ